MHQQLPKMAFVYEAIASEEAFKEIREVDSLEALEDSFTLLVDDGV
jgi:hypothetical protein